MVKILHIGPTHTPHTCDIFRQIKEKTDFKNAVLSYTPKKFVDDAVLFSDIPVYVHDYLDFLDTPKMRAFVDNVLSIEKPDIIIGHCFSQTAVLMNYALSVRNVPAVSFLWGYACYVRDFKSAQFKKIFFDNLAVLKRLNFLFETNQGVVDIAVQNYGIDKSDFAFVCPPINLAQYTNHIPDTSHPKLFLAKFRCEKYIYASLPATFKQFPNLEVHAFHVEPGITFAKRAKIYKRIIYHAPLPQNEFSDLIKRVNIVHTITADPGTGGTALQASYAGCINLMRRCASSAGVLEDNKNAIMCNLNVADVTQKLFYSVKNLNNLCKSFKENNRQLIQYDQENTWKAFHQALLYCLAGKKAKINPTYGDC